MGISEIIIVLLALIGYLSINYKIRAFINSPNRKSKALPRIYNVYLPFIIIPSYFIIYKGIIQKDLFWLVCGSAMFFILIVIIFRNKNRIEN